MFFVIVDLWVNKLGCLLVLIYVVDFFFIILDLVGVIQMFDEVEIDGVFFVLIVEG